MEGRENRFFHVLYPTTALHVSAKALEVNVRIMQSEFSYIMTTDSHVRSKVK